LGGAGNQAGDTANGQWNPTDFTYLMLYGCVAVGAMPNIDWPMEMTPVDFTAKLIVCIATRRFRGEVGKIFHLIDTQRLPSTDMQAYMNSFGYSLKTMQFADWTEAYVSPAALSR
jgi:thioester reductase-like protein